MDQVKNAQHRTISLKPLKKHTHENTMQHGITPLQYPIQNIIGNYGVTRHTKEISKGSFRKRADADQ